MAPLLILDYLAMRGFFSVLLHISGVVASRGFSSHDFATQLKKNATDGARELIRFMKVDPLSAHCSLLGVKLP